MQNKSFRSVLTVVVLVVFAIAVKAQNSNVVILGVVTDERGTPIPEAFVYIKNTDRYTSTNEKGFYKFYVSEGTYEIGCSMLGFNTDAQKVIAKTGENRLNFKLTSSSITELDAVSVQGKSHLQKVQETAYNVVAIDAKEMANNTLDLSDVLEQASGIKIRRSGGVGSDAAISLNGFTGNHVKVFMDGIPMQGFGSAFQINNIPVNIAERIEVYKGVVPIELGSDALGGAINIITKKHKNTFFDASYSYGSFNTHKTNINFGITGKSGLTLQLNAFQNFSNNSYRVKTKLLDLTTNEFSDEEYWFKRFHDTYHNETIITKVGVVDKSWADRFLVGSTFGTEAADVQNSAIQKIVYGGKERKAETKMASLEYLKKNVFTKGLTVKLSGNYSKVHNQVIDTMARQYNWAGDYREKSSKGEGVYTSSVFDNKTGVGMLNLNYRPSKRHQFAINNVLTTYSRVTTDDKANSENSSEIDFIERSNLKNVLGASYKFEPNKRWNTSVFGKHYNVNIIGPVEVPISSTRSEYVERQNKYNVTGYGLATTYGLFEGVQLKGSFEKTYRLPSERELYGDEIIETGDASLEAENSRNINFNVSYAASKKEQHYFYVDAGFIYRDIQDYIRRIVDESKGGASYKNHGQVKNWGADLEVNYAFENKLSIGGTVTYQDIRNKEMYTTNGTKALNYNDRMPNVPYLFANADASYNLFHFLRKNNTLTAGYHLNYTHEFFKEWESYGANKITIPMQLSHDLELIYAINKGKYNVSFEMRNLTDELLYDNYSLQKPGRSFYLKFRYFFSI